MIPETGSTWLDNFLQKVGGSLTSTAFAGLMNELTGGASGGAGGSAAATYGANPNLRPIQNESAGQENMAKFMELANSLQGQQTAQAPASPGFDVSRAFEPTRYAQNQQSLPDFLQSSNRNFA
jgi:hypothetical protein